MTTPRTRPTRHLLRSAVAAACATATVLTAACSTAAAPAAPPAPATAGAELPPGGVPGVPVPVIAWEDAGDGYQEATATVPLDYADPGGRSLDLHLVRLPATDPAQRIGTLFIDFGRRCWTGAVHEALGWTVAVVPQTTVVA